MDLRWLQVVMQYENMNKHKRYRQKCIRDGRCPHCGKSCAPFYECEERRKYKRLSRKKELIPVVYIRHLLTQNTQLESKDITRELIEFKRNHLKLFRLIRGGKYCEKP